MIPKKAGTDTNLNEQIDKDLSKVLLLVENRDNCKLNVPPLYEVKDEQKQKLKNDLIYTEECVNKKEIPNIIKDEKNCKFCNYVEVCRKRDEENYNPLK